MAKNRTMRAAVIMLALTLITSCFVGGTFAKYVTEGTASDSARVAKWGVTIEAGSGDLFSNTYVNDNGLTTVYSTDSDNDGERDLVVAPGTSGTASFFSIKGTPEVATSVTIDMRGGDVNLEYYNDSEGWETYYPVRFTLTHTYGYGAQSVGDVVAGEFFGATYSPVSLPNEYLDGEEVITGTLSQIERILDLFNENMQNVAPGYVFDNEFTLSWEWSFQIGNNVLDTVLGDIAAGKEIERFIMNGTEYTCDDADTELGYRISITVEQID